MIGEVWHTSPERSHYWIITFWLQITQKTEIFPCIHLNKMNNIQLENRKVGKKWKVNFQLMPTSRHQRDFFSYCIQHTVIFQLSILIDVAKEKPCQVKGPVLVLIAIRVWHSTHTKTRYISIHQPTTSYESMKQHIGYYFWQSQVSQQTFSSYF